jgi:hypothetical protein
VAAVWEVSFVSSHQEIDFSGQSTSDELVISRIAVSSKASFPADEIMADTSTFVSMTA